MAERLTLDPKLDLSAAPSLHAALLPLTAHDVVVDAREVTHMGALCTQILIAAAQSTRSAGHEFSLLNVNDRVLEQLAAMGLCPEAISEGIS